MVLAVILLIVTLGMLFGFLRGFKKSVVRIASVLLAAVLAFVFALVISNALIASGIAGDLLESLIEDFDEIEKLGSPTLIGLIQSVPVALVTPIIFLVLYFLFKAILWIPCKILYKVLKFDNKKKKKDVVENEPQLEETVTTSEVTSETEEGVEEISAEKIEFKNKVVSESKKRLQNKLLGIPLGAAQALVSVLVIMFVVGGYLFAADKVVEGLVDIDEAVAEEFEDVEEVLDDITSEPVIGLFCSGNSNNFVFEGLTRIDIDGEKCSLTKESASEVECPLIAESPLSLECKVTDVIELGSHHMFLADIVAVDVDDSLIDQAGKLHLERAGLAAFAHGEYFELGKKIGYFGFSAAKKHKKKPKNK